MVLDTGLLFDVGLIVVVATLAGYALRFFKQPIILAYILTGLFLGPFGLGSMNIFFGGFQVGINSLEEVVVFSELGIAFLLFGVGVETNFSKLFGMGKTVLVGGIVQVVLTVAVVVCLGVFFGLLSLQQSILLGAILAFSSTAIVVKILLERREIGSVHGKLLVGFLLVQDLLVIIALPVLSNSLSIFLPDFLLLVLGQAFLILAFAFFLNRFVYPKIFLFSSHSDELLFLASISSCFVFILLAFAIGFPISIGAFVAGLALSNLPYNLEVFNKIKGLRDFFSALFFVTLGMQVSLSFENFSAGIFLLLFGVVFIAKPLIFYLITIFSGYGGRIAVAVALGLAQVSEFSFIIAAGARGVLEQTPGLYSAVILVIAFSMAISHYLYSFSPSVYSFFKPRVIEPVYSFYRARFRKRIDSLSGEHSDLSSHVLIVGGGVVGFALAKALFKKHKVMVVDHNSDAVERCRENGIRAMYGRADNEEALINAGILKARLLVLGIPDISSAAFLARGAKQKNPSITIFGRAHYYSDALKLFDAGVDYVVMTHVVSGNIFLENVAHFLETNRPSNLQNFSDEYRQFVKEMATQEKQGNEESEYKNF